MTSEAELVALIPRWLAQTHGVDVPTGLRREEAVRRAVDLYHRLKMNRLVPSELELNDDFKDTLHGLVQVALPMTRVTLRSAADVFRLIERLPWPEHDYQEKQDLLQIVASLGWRAMGCDPDEVLILRKNAGDPQAPLPATFTSQSSGATTTGQSWRQVGQISQSAAEEIRRGAGGSLMALFRFCRYLAELNEYSVSEARLEAMRIRKLLEESPSAGVFDERQYFLAELARLVGVSCRIAGRWQEAATWLDQAEAGFARTLCPTVGAAQIAYARLGLMFHRYRLLEAIEGSGPLETIFERLSMQTQAVKCRVVKAMALKGLGRLDEAVLLFEAITAKTTSGEATMRVRLLTHLGNAYREQGRTADAERVLTEALKLWPEREASVCGADAKFIFADLLRAQGRSGPAKALFARAKLEYLSLGMDWFAAYAAVLLAETELAMGEAANAEAEIRWALPILQEREMVPEGYAALALLTQSIRKRNVDSGALQELRQKLSRGL